MGMPTGFSRNKTSDNYEELKVSKYDPNPSKFEITRCVERNGNTAISVNYPNCLNYEGDKVIVYKGFHALKVRGLKELDPHFTQENDVVKPFARFEPTEEGWDKAVMLLDII